MDVWNVWDVWGVGSADTGCSFVRTFGLQNRKVYIAGESYAGMSVPYIRSHFLDQNDTKNFDVRGAMIYDPSKTLWFGLAFVGLHD